MLYLRLQLLDIGGYEFADVLVGLLPDVLGVDDETGQELALAAVYGHSEEVVLLDLGVGVEEGLELYLFEGELLLGQVGDHGLLHDAVVVHEELGHRDDLVADGLQGDLELAAYLDVGIGDLLLLLVDEPQLLLDGLELLHEVLVGALAGVEALVLLVHVVDELDVGEGVLVGLDVADHRLMRPEVLLAQLEQDLLVRLVRPDQSLEGQDEVGVVVEDVVAQ